MNGEWIGKGLLRKASRSVRPGNGTQRPVHFGKVIEHPHDVTNPVAFFVGNGPHVGVERLRGTSTDDCRTSVETTELDVGAEDMSDKGQDGGVGDGTLKYGAFIDQIGQPLGPRFELEIRTGRVAFFVEEFSDSLTEGVDFGRTQELP